MAERFVSVLGILTIASMGCVAVFSGTSLARWAVEKQTDAGTLIAGQFSLQIGDPGVFNAFVNGKTVATNQDPSKVDPVCGTGTAMTYTETLRIGIDSNDAQVSNMVADLAVFGTEGDFSNVSGMTAELVDPDGISLGTVDAADITEVPLTNQLPTNYGASWALDGVAGDYTLTWTWTQLCDTWTPVRLILPPHSYLLVQRG